MQHKLNEKAKSKKGYNGVTRVSVSWEELTRSKEDLEESGLILREWECVASECIFNILQREYYTHTIKRQNMQNTT